MSEDKGELEPAADSSVPGTSRDDGNDEESVRTRPNSPLSFDNTPKLKGNDSSVGGKDPCEAFNVKTDVQIDKLKGESTQESEEGFIKLRVLGSQNSNGILFRLKCTTPLLKLKKSYSNNEGIPLGELRFLFDGKRITDEHTPKELDMVDDDQIEVYHEQTGGIFLLN